MCWVGAPRLLLFFECTNGLRRIDCPATAEYGKPREEHAQVRAAASSRYLEVGSHTVTHPFLSRRSRAEQFDEIMHSREILASLTGRRIRYFAYPAGDYDRETLGLVKEAKFDVTVLGTAPLASVEVLRNNEVVHAWKFKEGTNELKASWTDPAPLRDAKDASYYYVRVTQTDAQMAWSSPMWLRVGK